MEPGTAPHLFHRALTDRQAAPALDFGATTLTFGDLDARAARMAAALRARGLAAGNRLALYLENRVEFIDLFLACARLGVILVPINILYREREVGHILADAEPRAIVASGPVPGGAAYWDVDELSDDPGAEAPGLHRNGEAPGLALTADTPAAIIYTSGTTGVAKGAIITQGNLVANARALVEAWGITRDDRLLLPLPLFHVHGLGNGVCCWLATGCRMRLLPRFDAAHALAEFRAFGPR